GAGAFDLADAGRARGSDADRADGGRGAASDDDAAPLALRGFGGRAFDVGAAGEDDRRGGRAFSEDLRAAVDQQVVRTAGAEDAHAGFHGQYALGAARARSRRIGAAVGADFGAAADGVNRASAQRHRQGTENLLR